MCVFDDKHLYSIVTTCLNEALEVELRCVHVCVCTSTWVLNDDIDVQSRCCLFLPGIIKVNDDSQLDYETMSDIRLIVEASSGADRAYTTVWVYLQDVNDNAPLFTQDRYVTAVYEGMSSENHVM